MLCSQDVLSVYDVHPPPNHIYNCLCQSVTVDHAQHILPLNTVSGTLVYLLGVSVVSLNATENHFPIPTVSIFDEVEIHCITLCPNDVTERCVSVQAFVLTSWGSFVLVY
jgi:hypothetical protein